MNSIHSTYLSSVIIFNRNFVNLGLSREYASGTWLQLMDTPSLRGWGIIGG
ncbi:TPA: hypothetical protein ACY3K0_005893 [Klebsiella michiganensis]|nr:hypothetical protein [Klebsiella michiganensis]